VNAEQVLLVLAASREWAYQGALGVDTYARLTNAGLDADAVIEAFTNDPEIN
jgi:hypothetical protein